MGFAQQRRLFWICASPFIGVDSRQIAEAMASKAGVLVIPGAFFGAGQDGALRFAFANAGRDVIAQLGSRLSPFSPY